MKLIIQGFASSFFTEEKPYEQLIKIATHYEKFIPEHLRKEMKGISDALKPISYEDVLLQNCFIDLIYGRFIPENISNPVFNSYNLACTSFGVINKDSNIIGQNFDFSLIFEPCLSFVLIKMPDKPDIFTLRMGSLLSLPAGRSSNGISLAVNIVKSNNVGKLSIPASIKARLAFENCKDAKSFYSFQIETPNTASNNLLISDDSKIIALENLPDILVREDVKDIIVRSNTFVSESLQKYLVDKTYSKERQKYTEIRLKQLYNSEKISENELIKLLSDEPIICRTDPLNTMTLAFITKNYFGLGNTKHKSLGRIPIKNRD
jgi:hypothetical protein